ncbi:autotransporter outer membrane beta-barrel domain-containing protein [Rhodoligotrophos defluvii]|uniref:autotransporter outer membrane beta-barrel domain-containing protein n=1 Tax=Rhodoligotrophos defluvii TaxID=2561934 RepID=UPI0010C9D927|nr:autotransporter outer membrane beta-barrel domain-containing protein [Rhodoligotrophos defluvii]
MNSKLVRGLLASASLIGMAVGAVTAANAAGQTINANVPSFTNNANNLDFIEITNTGSVDGDVVNNGQIGTVVINDIGIENDGVVGGSIINNGLIEASEIGILNTGVVEGDIVNSAGATINAGTNFGSGSHFAAGIISFETGDDGQTIVNDGIVNVDAIGTNDNNLIAAVGVAAIGLTTGDYSAVVDNNGDIFVDAVAVDDADSAAVTAIAGGAFAGALSGGNADAVVDNAGTIDVSAAAHEEAGAAGNVANALALAVGQGSIAIGAEDANADFLNAAGGELLVSADATANENAIAGAIGAVNVAVAGENADSFVDNDGTIDVVANAIASGVGANEASATALAFGVGGIQAAVGGDSGTAQFDNDGSLNVDANATAGDADEVLAVAAGVGWVQAGVGGDTGSAIINNTSPNSFTVDVDAIAGATAAGVPTDPTATAVGIGLGSLQFAGGNDATALLNNSGSASVDVLADAQATQQANAIGLGIGAIQFVSATHIANASILNGGSFDVGVTANAFASGGAFPDATAAAIAAGGLQIVSGEEASGLLDNDGSFTVNALANAEAVGADSDAFALALGAGMAQIVTGETATASIDNGTAGSYFVSGVANATAAESATAAGIGLGYLQVAAAENLATAEFNNDGDFDVLGDGFASATGVGGEAFAAGGAIGGAQVAIGAGMTPGDAQALFSNNGTYDVVGVATAMATNDFGDASAIAFGAGNIQLAVGDNAIASMINGTAGAYTVDVDASAVADDDAFALALGAGFAQIAAATNDDALIDLTNDGSMSVDADAFASGGDTVIAAGVGIGGLQAAIAPDDVADSSFVNNGSFSVDGSGVAVADGTGAANAIGVGAGVAQIGLGETAINNFANGTDASFVVTGFADADAVSSATAFALAAGVAQIGIGTDDSFADVVNDGSIDVDAVADADATGANGTAAAAALGIGGLQVAVGITGVADAAFVNNGTFAANAVANATANGASGSATAAAIVAGFAQVAAGSELAIADIDNSGTFTFGADANASAGDSANAVGFGIGMAQVAIGTDEADALMYNGTAASIDGDIVANAAGGTFAGATAVGIGGLQLALSEDDAYAELINDGSIDVVASAVANGGTGSAAALGVLIGHAQVALAATGSGTAAVSIVNNGVVNYLASAEAVADDTATASALAIGFAQVAVAETASASLENTGEIYVDADSYAEADAAFAGAAAIGGIQAAIAPNPASGGAAVSFTNSNIYDVGAVAEAQGATAATASASAVGLIQLAVGSTATFENSGSYNVESIAIAEGAGNANLASAGATGSFILGADPQGDDGFNVDFLNSGDYTVSAYARAGELSNEVGVAAATAAGLVVAGTETHGIIENTGNFLVAAEAVGTTSTANALGIGVFADSFDGEIYNSGLIDVVAIGENAAAAGIVVQTATGTAPSFIVNDGGTIIARTLSSVKAYEESTDFFHRGVAIDVANTNAPVSIDLLGGDDYGAIYGHIFIGDNDEVNVSEGTTYFSGIINPDQATVGDLNLLTGGELILVNDRIDGPSGAFVENYAQQADSILGLNIRPDSAPFIVADNVTLDGTALILPEAGLYADTTIYEDVIDSATPIVGEWDNVASVSPLLQPVFVDDGANNLDLVVERVAFGDVAGLSKNQSNVGDGIENVYDDLLANPVVNTPFDNLVANLFTLDYGQYANALNQLSGAEYAQQIQSALWSFRLLNNVVGERLRMVGPNDNCAIASYPTAAAEVGGSAVAPAADLYVPAPAVVCAPSRASIWARVTGQWSSDDGDSNGPKYDQDTYAVYGGIDWGFAPTWKVGVTAGYISADMDFKRNSNKIDYDGLQVAGYGAWDNGVNYAHGILGYGHYSNDSRRNIAIGVNTWDPFGQKPFGTQPEGITDRLKGDWNSDVLSIYGETGYRYWMTPTASLTPFLSLNYVKVWNDSFTESSATGSGARLDVKSNDGESFNTQLGARLATQLPMGAAIIAPELRVAWQHEWLDRYQTASASFAAAPGSNFSVYSTREGRDFAVVGAGATIGFTEALDFTVDYDGRFNSKHEDHSVVGRVTYKF